MEPRKEKVKSALLSHIESVKLGDLIRTEEKIGMSSKRRISDGQDEPSLGK